MPVRNDKLKKFAGLTPRMSPTEKQLICHMHFAGKQRPTDIAKSTGRDLSAVCRTLKAVAKPTRLGRPPALTQAQVDKLEKTLKAMIKQAAGRYEVSLGNPTPSTVLCFVSRWVCALL